MIRASVSVEPLERRQLLATLAASAFQSGADAEAPIPIATFSFSGLNYQAMQSINLLTLRLTLVDGDSGNTQADEGDLTLLLDGITTGILLNGFDDNQTVTLTVGAAPPQNAGNILSALQSDGTLVASIADRDRDGNLILVPSNRVATLTISGTTSDLLAPTVGSPTFSADNPTHAVTVAASEALVGTDEAVFLNQTTGQLIRPGEFAVAQNPGTFTLNFTFPGLPNGRLPEGLWKLTLPAAAVRDLAGNELDGDANGSAGGDFDFNFHFLVGDADGNRSVDIDDFGILASRFNQQGTFSQGDFDYSGLADIDDFGLLATRFNSTLASAAPTAHSNALSLFSSQRTIDVESPQDSLEQLISANEPRRCVTRPALSPAIADPADPER